MEPDREFYLRELADVTGLAASTVSRIVDDLENQEIIRVEKDLKMSIVAKDSDRFRDLKRSFNLWKLAESDLIDELEEESVPEGIVLFGSYSRGEDRSGSDIDIAVVNGRKVELQVEGFEDLLERKVNIQNVKTGEMTKEFRESLANGITLRGYLEI